jgi:hypothetical protein
MEDAEHLRMMAKRALALAIETTDNPELVDSLVVMAGQYLEQVAALEMAREAAQPPDQQIDPTILTDAKTVLRLADAPNSRPGRYRPIELFSVLFVAYLFHPIDLFPI